MKNLNLVRLNAQNINDLLNEDNKIVIADDTGI